MIVEFFSADIEFRVCKTHENKRNEYRVIDIDNNSMDLIENKFETRAG